MRITSKGQVTIPQEIREKYGFLPNTEIDFVEEDGKIRLVKKTGNGSSMRQRLMKVSGSATVKMRTEEIMRLTRGWDKPER